MEYVLIGKDGKSHDYFPTRAEALNALHEEEHTSPGLTQGWMIQAYGENGEELGEPEWADELLAPPAETTVSFVTGPEGLGCYRVRQGRRRPERRGPGILGFAVHPKSPNVLASSRKRERREHNQRASRKRRCQVRCVYARYVVLVLKDEVRGHAFGGFARFDRRTVGIGHL